LTSSAERHQAQVDYWNNGGGERWAKAEEHTGLMLEPVTRVLMEKARPRPGMAILDIGCGGGGTTFELAKRVGPEGRVLGVDVSAVLAGLAKGRAPDIGNAGFLHADAALHPFEPFADLAISRFGVMFFGDPPAAFRNIRKALKPRGRLVFACWRDLTDNPWMLVPLNAVQEAGIPPAPRPAPGEPGPFAFADPDRVTEILNSAEFTGIELTPIGLSLDVAGGGGLSAAVAQSLTIGAAAAALRDQPPGLREAAKPFIEAALRPYQRGSSVTMPAAIWLVEAQA
jgi:SAM-dependent methyltransferase